MTRIERAEVRSPLSCVPSYAVELVRSLEQTTHQVMSRGFPLIRKLRYRLRHESERSSPGARNTEWLRVLHSQHSEIYQDLAGGSVGGTTDSGNSLGLAILLGSQSCSPAALSF
jgi:hypothetical protein